MSAALPLEIDVTEVSTLQQENTQFLLLDCREQNEFDTARIPGSQLIPMGQIADRVQELEEFRNLRIVVHCHHGGRSLRVTNWLRRNGFALAQNMRGGIDAWSLKVDNSVPRYK